MIAGNEEGRAALASLFEDRLTRAGGPLGWRSAPAGEVPGGYWGRLLHVDLARRRWEFLPLEEQLLRRTIGGGSLGAALLHRWCPAGADPLGPENPLLLVTSPLLGTPLTTTAKYTVVTKSPLTGFITDSLSSSFFALALKGCGADAVVLTGRASQPTWLELDGSGVRFHDARALWGRPAGEAARTLRDRLGRRVRVAAIGPAGERLVRFATISNDRRHAGRGGVGAVMGSKNLKAVAVHSGPVPGAADPQALLEIAARVRERSLGPATLKYRSLGTTANVALFNRLAALPSYNFRRSTFDGAERLTGETLAAERRVKRLSCAGCTVGCEHVFKSAKTGGAGRLEYETLFALGPLLGVSDPDAVLQSAQLCDLLGLDTISAGGTIAWALEAEEKGLFARAGFAPLQARFGDGEGVARLLTSIAERRGVGDLLAEGSLRAARTVGGGSEHYAMQVKGMELPGYEPRSLQTMAVGLAVGSRGACHNRSGAYEADFSPGVDRLRADETRGRLAAESEDRSSLMDSLVLCKFLRHCFEDVYEQGAEMMRAVTGWDVTPAELRTTAERATSLKKAFNLREGWTPADDTLPERILTESLPSGVAAGVSLTREDLRMMIDAYYEARGWAKDGTITPATRQRLDLAGVLGESS
ncbi:MAG: aldehyde ferredoxin oxidoreductase family protein [Gemmatimonadetes bacterium]|nr:aldehyde ferredoxin oxidoreductase family protein [Gemmatimonadota bacterium]